MQAKNNARYSALILLCLLLTSACQVSNPITGRKALRIINPTSLYGETEQAYRAEVNGNTVCQDKATNALVGQVAQRLILNTQQLYTDLGKTNEIQGFNWEVTVLDAPDVVNATCRPGGKIIVYTGILPIAANPDGLAAILGHEIGHALANHSAERQSQDLLKSIIGVATEITIGATSGEDNRFLASELYNVGSYLGFVLPYSRKHESEADLIGLKLMALSGYDPKEAPRVWERMDARYGDQGSDFFSTHPSNKKRMNALRKNIPEAMLFARKYGKKQPLLQMPSVPTQSEMPVVSEGKKTDASSAAPMTLTEKKPSVNKADSRFKYQYQGADDFGEKLTFQSTATPATQLCYRVQVKILPTYAPEDKAFSALISLGPVYWEYLPQRNNYRVLVGNFKSESEALDMACRAKKLGFSNVFTEKYEKGNRTQEKYASHRCN